MVITLDLLVVGMLAVMVLEGLMMTEMMLAEVYRS